MLNICLAFSESIIIHDGAVNNPVIISSLINKEINAGGINIDVERDWRCRIDKRVLRTTSFTLN